jgi:uncharacterized protein (TIGR03067 family)
MGCRAIVFLGVALVAGGGSDDAVKKELKKFQGTWKVVRMQVDGVKIPLEAFDKTTVVVTGDKFSFRDKGRVYEEIEVVLDLAKKPREIDLHFPRLAKRCGRLKSMYQHSPAFMTSRRPLTTKATSGFVVTGMCSRTSPSAKPSW